MATRQARVPETIVVVGSVALDTVITPFARADEVLGGAATYFSMAARLLAPCKLVAVVGRDFPSEHVDLLRGHGIDLEGLQVVEGRSFRWSGRYADDLVHRETLETQLNVFADFHPRLPAAYVAAPVVFCANIDPELQLEVLGQMGKARFSACDTMNLWIETRRAGLDEMFRRVDLVFVNAEEARQYAGTSSLVEAADTIRRQGAGAVIIKKGEDGALLVDRHGYFAAPAFPVRRVVDPTGAGDAFAGGVMGYLARGGRVDTHTLRRAVLVGNALGAFSVEDFSVRRLAALKWRDLQTRYQAIRAMMAVDGTL
jgi:sugar/nucleoside kinase (ribokinase family)